jgi:hypothetical protein
LFLTELTRAIAKQNIAAPNTVCGLFPMTFKFSCKQK